MASVVKPNTDKIIANILRRHDLKDGRKRICIANAITNNHSITSIFENRTQFAHYAAPFPQQAKTTRDNAAARRAAP